MSIASEITRIQTAKENIKTSIINKGGTLVSDALLSDYAAAIDAIPASGGQGQEDYGIGTLIYEGTFSDAVNTFSVTTLPDGSSFAFDKITVELSHVFQGQNVNKRIYWRSDMPMEGYDEPLILDPGSAYRYNITYHAITTITINGDYINLVSINQDENDLTSTTSTYQQKRHNGYDKITAYGWWSWACPAGAEIKIIGYKRKKLTLISKTITSNGTYYAEDDNADGYTNVIINTEGNGGLTLLDTIEVNDVNGIQTDIDMSWFDTYDYVMMVPDLTFSRTDWLYIAQDATTGGPYASLMPSMGIQQSIFLGMTGNKLWGAWFRDSQSRPNPSDPVSYLYWYLYSASNTMTGTIKIYGIKVTA